MGPSALLDLSAQASGQVPKLEHEAEGQVLYFLWWDWKRVRINPIVHEGAIALIDL